MKLRSFVKRGFVILSVYSIVTFCVLMTADRVERLEENGFSTTNCGVAIKIGG